ncbi:MAG TPA: PH domain-containing protein [Paludibacteraceae bacterium]|nr:PH domain-containing protein [Paludibacteraceae bacterium]
MMKLLFRGNKFIEIVIYSIAIGIGMVLMLITRHSFWYLVPYILLEIILLYFLITFRYVIVNQTVKVQYGFLNVKSIGIQNIHKIIIQDKQKGEPKITPHRIEIQYDKAKKIEVSPKDTVGFVEIIERINPGIEII